jgi:hypothetical protein
VTILIAVHDSWSANDPAGMGRLLAAAKALESPCPAPTPPPPSPADDPDDLGELLAGMTDDDPAPPAPARSAARRTDAVKAARRPAQLRDTSTPATPAPSTPASSRPDWQPSTAKKLYGFARENNLLRKLMSTFP